MPRGVEYKSAVSDIVESKNFRRVPQNFTPEEAMDARREALSCLTDTDLGDLSNPSFNVGVVSTRNTENLIGKVEIPLGVAGPLLIRGQYVSGEYFVPMATTEGALIASTARGMAAITKSGGVETKVLQSSMTRAPVFRAGSPGQAKEFVEWVQGHEAAISQRCEETSRHLKYIGVTPFVDESVVFLRFAFDTGDAMGMNMATIAVNAAVRDLIIPGTGVDLVALSGNMCVDKKASTVNFESTRGHATRASVVIPKEVLATVLKTTAERVEVVNTLKNVLGSKHAGAIGNNAHHANMLAAVFIATGQDLAHVSEASIGTTFAERQGEDLFFEVYLPDLPVGTVGGGTNLAIQRSCLESLGVAGSGDPVGSNAKGLAEIIAGTVLAGELSLLSSLAESSLAQAHERLARGKS
jgi:hydroxymethylglutaryl-CoA reductase (NADPH)